MADEPKKTSVKNKQTIEANKNSVSAKKNPYVEFENFVESKTKCEDSKIAIFSHSSPDPDAIASMMGLAWLLERKYKVQCHLYYSGEIAHPQNSCMVNLLNPTLMRVSEDYDARKSSYCAHMLVDTIPSNAGVCGEKINFDVVIDHHKDLPPASWEGILIHRKVGSCSSIIFDMMKDLINPNNWFDENVDTDKKVATALIAGIMTDTHFMLSEDCTEYEHNAFSELVEFRDISALNQIVFFQRKRFWIDKKASAVHEANVDDEGFAVVGLGLIPEKERDLISDMADDMIGWANVRTAIAFAVIGGDRIEGSVRSLNASLTVSDFCKKLGGKHGGGGGKQGKGAYKLPLAGFSIDPDEDDEDAQDAWESIKKRESKRIMRVISR